MADQNLFRWLSRPFIPGFERRGFFPYFDLLIKIRCQILDLFPSPGHVTLTPA